MIWIIDNDNFTHGFWIQDLPFLVITNWNIMSISAFRWFRYVLYIGLFFVVMMSWYVWKYSMDPVIDREFGNPSIATRSILIATQGSNFKNHIAENLIEHFTSSETYIKVIDTYTLNQIKESDWSAIFINHTFEISKAPEGVVTFLDRCLNKEKVVVFGTSGDSRLKLDHVDAMSGASMMKNVNLRSQEVIDRLHKILDKI